MKIEILDNFVKSDPRGSLAVVEGMKNIPFDIKRVYYIWGFPKNVTRGAHAHHKTRQAMICLKGSCKVLFDDAKSKEEITLDANNSIVMIEPYQWHTMEALEDDCMLLVFADQEYNEADYIRSYDEFIDIMKTNAS
jgi:dTDP-4-dehydrorhamnose 3,5-epimerase-like enzyme